MTDTRKVEPELEKLRALRDDLRLKMHLAKMEAKATWSDLEPRVNQLIDQADKSLSALPRQIVNDAIRALEKLRTSI